MRHLLFLLFAVLGLQAIAQDSNTFIVMSVSGKATYHDGNSTTEKPLLPGQKLTDNATITVNDNARATLVYQKKSITLEKAGNFLLQTFAAQTSKGSSTFINRFFDYIQEGITNTGSPKDLEKYHEKYIAKASGGIKGFAGGEYGVIATIPVVGVLRDVPITFDWFATGDSSFYDFEILDYQTDGVIYKALLRDTFATIELQKLALEPGRKYYWMVQKKRPNELNMGFAFGDDPTKRSPKVEFIIDDNKWASLMSDLKNADDYKTADAFNQALMKAAMLEDNQFIYAAYLAYQEAQQLQPDNPLVKNLMSAFLARQGLLRAGLSVLPQ